MRPVCSPEWPSSCLDVMEYIYKASYGQLKGRGWSEWVTVASASMDCEKDLHCIPHTTQDNKVITTKHQFYSSLITIDT